ncbi:MAG: hypothetical protein KJ718_00210 [Nanoarchaeota archaeon]|nr:hypothetical protein [Nanoarchaeota archaeon]MBU1050963.1 hypothetical protein [Nanoarchaeota archaeon]
MNKKEVLQALPIILFIIIINILAVSGIAEEENIIASISNPRMVLYKAITNNEPLEFQNSVFVNNENDFEVKITIKPMGVWKENAKVREETFTLQPDERKEAIYDITITEPGEYAGEILVLFEKQGYPNTLSLMQRLVVHVTEEDTKPSIAGNAIGNSGIKILGTSTTILFLVVLVLLSIFVRKKQVKKSGEKNNRKK